MPKGGAGMPIGGLYEAEELVGIKTIPIKQIVITIRKVKK
jgi:hypothetical protein